VRWVVAGCFCCFGFWWVCGWGCRFVLAGGFWGGLSRVFVWLVGCVVVSYCCWLDVGVCFPCFPWSGGWLSVLVWNACLLLVLGFVVFGGFGLWWWLCVILGSCCLFRVLVVWLSLFVGFVVVCRWAGGVVFSVCQVTYRVTCLFCGVLLDCLFYFFLVGLGWVESVF